MMFLLLLFCSCQSALHSQPRRLTTFLGQFYNTVLIDFTNHLWDKGRTWKQTSHWIRQKWVSLAFPQFPKSSYSTCFFPPEEDLTDFFPTLHMHQMSQRRLKFDQILFDPSLLRAACQWRVELAFKQTTKKRQYITAEAGESPQKKPGR